MMVHRATLALLSLGPLAAAHRFTQDPVVLRLAPPVGQVSRYRSQVEMWTRLPSIPATDSATSTVRSTLSLTQTVVRADGDLRDVQVTYDSIRFEPPTMVEMGRQAGQMMQGLIVTMRVDPRGRVLSSDARGGALPTTNGFSQMTNRGALQIPVLPEGAVTSGATWADSQSVALPVGASQSRTSLKVVYRLTRLERQPDALWAVISGSGTITSEAGGMPMGSTGSIVSEFLLDLSAGRLVRATSTMNLVTDTPMLAQTIKMRVVATTVLVSNAHHTP